MTIRNRKTPKPKPAKTKKQTILEEQVRLIKEDILKLLGDGSVYTLAAAAKLLGLAPITVYNMTRDDKSFQEQYEQAREVLADKLEEILLKSTNIVAQIFMLKGLRPHIYRDNYKMIVTDTRTLALLEELRNLGHTPKQIESEAIEGQYKVLVDEISKETDCQTNSNKS